MWKHLRVIAGVLACGLGVLVAFATTPSFATGTAVHCENGADLQAAIDGASAGATLSVTGACVGNFEIGKNLSLTANTASGVVTLDGNNAGPVVVVLPGATVNVTGFTITHGLGDFRVVNGSNFPVAGGVNNFGTLTLSKVLVTGNSGQSDGGVTFWSGSSGLPTGTLVISASVISGNTADGNGGIFAGPNGVGPLTLKNTSVIDNTGGLTGGIASYGAITLIKSSVTGNTATNPNVTVKVGGVGLNGSAHLAMTSATVSGNTPCDICAS